MNGSQTHVHPEHRYASIANGSLTEGIGAIAVIVLAIIGLAGAFTNVVASIGTIVAGLVFLADGMLTRSAVNALHTEGTSAGIGSGANAVFYAGLASIILGILSFFHSMPAPMIAVAVLVMGAALFLGGGTLARLQALLHEPQETHATWAANDSGSTFVGLAVTVLGILAVIGLLPMTLALVGLLCLGAGALFSRAPSEAAQT